jgi:hypothetical protein
MTINVYTSTSVDVTAAGSWGSALTPSSGGTGNAVSGSWTRISGTYAIPSTAKSVMVQIITTSTVTNGDIVYLSQAQLELGSVATQFSRAGGTIQGELAACQRYYYRMSNAIAYEPFGAGYGVSATRANAQIKYPVPLRSTPTSIDYANLGLYDGGTTTAVTVLATDTGISKDLARLAVTTASGITQYRPYELLSDNSTSAYVGFSAEL